MTEDDERKLLRAEMDRLSAAIDGQLKMMPWDRVELRGWSIGGLNHYHVDGERRLFVAMTDNLGRCVRAEGPDEVEVFKSLARQVFNLSVYRSPA